jgi:hypothetical protein
MSGIYKRNNDKRWDRDTPPRSRFAYAAHATKARNKLARIEGDMIRAGLDIPTYEGVV